ncbi:sensor histidine kinase [Brevibacillus sp. SYSU BS000544]|uniref:sensor histidine kinase n=1 Tax=Brevibacillus sp. SYSU BS000544 TaxID=3416443 RepID=UPI003CE51F27
MFKLTLHALQKRFLSIWFLILTVLVVLPTSYTMETPLQFSATAFLSIFLLVLFWVPNHFLTSRRTFVSVFFFGILILLKGPLVGGEEAFGMMLPLAVFMGGKMEDKQGMILASFFGLMSAARAFSLDSIPVHSSISFILTFIGCFAGARGYRVQSEAYRTNQLHLEQLQKAHNELQLAHDEIQEGAVNTMQVIVLQERTRIARDMHDALGHSLTSLIVQLRALQYMLKEDGPPLAEKAVKDMLSVAKHSLDEIRNSVHTLAIDSSSIGHTTLRAFLSQTSNNTGLSINFEAETEIHIEKEVLLVFYRVLQEAVTNTLRHSDATLMNVKIKVIDESLLLSIWDNGTFTSDNPFTPGFGIKGMKERVQSIHGTLTCTIREPNGFQIDINVPYQNHDEKGMST